MNLKMVYLFSSYFSLFTLYITCAFQDEHNPFQLAVKPGDGFVPEDGDLRALTSIDSRLRELIPPDDYESIASSSSLSHLPKVQSYLVRRFRRH